MPPHGPAGLGPAREDGQPDLHRGTGARLGRGLHFAKKCRPRHRDTDRDDLQGRGAILANGEPLADHGGGQFDFGFAVDWMRKDLGICLGEARKNGAHLPVTALVDQFYADVQAMGGKRWDTSSLIALLDR